MELITKIENFLSEKKKWTQDIDIKKGSMHEILGLDPKVKISSKYSGVALAKALVSKVGKQKASSMINFSANVSSEEDVFDKAQTALKNINENNENDSYMIPQHLKSMYEKIESILEYTEKNKDIDSWVESHIIEASTKIDDVYEYIKNGKEELK